MLGAAATLLALRDSGARVVNLLLNLSSPEEIERRTAEAVEAHRRSGFELRVFDRSLLRGKAVSEDPAGAEDAVTKELAQTIAELEPSVVVGPQPHDLHEAHELAGRAVRRALMTSDLAPQWWMWGLWADLPLPSLYCPFDEARLDEVLHVLSAYEGELERNDYSPLVRGRGLVGAVAGSERVFGFGAPAASSAPYADLLMTVRREGSSWMLGKSALWESGSPYPWQASAAVDAWLDERSAASRLASWRMRRGRELFG